MAKKDLHCRKTLSTVQTKGSKFYFLKGKARPFRASPSMPTEHHIHHRRPDGLEMILPKEGDLTSEKGSWKGISKDDIGFISFGQRQGGQS